MDKNTLLQRQIEAKTKFDDLAQQIATLETQIQPLNEEKLRLQGDYRTITDLIANISDTPESTEDVPTDVPVEGEVVDANTINAEPAETE